MRERLVSAGMWGLFAGMLFGPAAILVAVGVWSWWMLVALGVGVAFGGAFLGLGIRFLPPFLGKMVGAVLGGQDQTPVIEKEDLDRAISKAVRDREKT